ncbi:MAG: hypothetical protein A3I89_01005 [Candidatus Harrisonbacteria bacterium RIFCSPLOWO2_02_FULL_41_11]|uniref:Gingipain domain-containing protein n=1 Tax=Candidatus Harrisonbacteria bacterium RIFCSPHIGHO2_02_FULL_42_16 TaxID=1798404 RepID=A0A1G1ZFA2_9BACT|nr:MAG: hypothetical protein A3B92_03790 [Candidatus Harrisonbacteria bacterium RIFCSPHIGHO2_02_FULL_42_16]OGY66988.1 MAG: hypothetical protein A3I89_01005 [Candidatus Harrisonbacteria bacterium RIFCSPLOWO2_02_FULL_41_11]
MRALIISGTDDAQQLGLEFQSYLRGQVGLADSQITYHKMYRYHQRYQGFGAGNIYEMLEKILTGSGVEPFVLYYTGHGLKYGWSPDDCLYIFYDRIFKILAEHRKEIIFLNDCCYAMAAARYQKLLKNKSLIYWFGSGKSGRLGFGIETGLKRVAKLPTG